VTNATRGKAKGTILTLVLAAAVIAGFSLFDPSKKKGEDEIPLTVHVSQTLEGRKPKGVIVAIIVNDRTLGVYYPSEQIWTMPVTAPKGSSVGVGVWQITPGTVSCAIRRGSNVMSNDLTSKVTPESVSITTKQAIETAAKCYYFVLS